MGSGLTTDRAKAHRRKYGNAPTGHWNPQQARIQRLDAETACLPPTADDVLASPGQPLGSRAQALMGSRLGYDFSQVRVHTGSHAAASARTMDAIAYTVGHDVVLPEKDSVTDIRLLAHELAHVVQQSSAVNAETPTSVAEPSHGAEREAVMAADAVTVGRSFHPTMRTGLAVQRQGPPGPVTLAGLTARRDAFNNAGAPDASNCATNLPAALGVDGPALGQNGMELIFRITGAIPAGTEFEITRTRASGLWQRDAGVWTRVSGDPAGTSDDHHDEDECHTPTGGRIFVVDTPGLPGTLDPTGIAFVDGGMVAATATAAVRKFSFAEWVMARNRRMGISWQRISVPTFHRWHSILSVSLVGGVWTRVDTPSGQHNEIELGSIGTTGATP